MGPRPVWVLWMLPCEPQTQRWHPLFMRPVVWGSGRPRAHLMARADEHRRAFAGHTAALAIAMQLLAMRMRKFATAGSPHAVDLCFA